MCFIGSVSPGPDLDQVLVPSRAVTWARPWAQAVSLDSAGLPMTSYGCPLSAMAGNGCPKNPQSFFFPANQTTTSKRQFVFLFFLVATNESIHVVDRSACDSGSHDARPAPNS